MPYGEKFEEALKYAARIHRDQTRKGTKIPYVTHLLAVAAIVGENGGTEDEVVAALLHDAPEDQGGEARLKDIREKFGDEVADIVAANSDTFEDPKPPWRERKEAYVAHVAQAPRSVRLVSAADKLHNARSVLADLRSLGDDLWPRFNGGKEGTLWYYRTLVEAFEAAGPNPVVEELDRVVGELERLASDSRRNALQNEPLRLGILGAARIALGGIIPAAARTDAVEVTAVATRGSEKSRTVREAAPEAHLFEDYDSLLEDASIEAVYVPLPNSMHVEWTLRALAAGKHVLCEKPFSLDAGGAERAVEAAREAGLTLMEGFMFRLHPQTLQLKALISEGAVGDVRQAVAQFGHRLDDPADVRGVGSLGGGSLGDVGCYCVSALRLAFGAEPRRASAFARFDEEGADRELAGVLEFDAGFGVVSSSISSARRERLEIVGTEGAISLDAPFRADKSGGTMEVTRGGETSTETFEAADPYRAELEEFAAAIREGRDPAVGPAEILGNARAIHALLFSARQGGRAQSL